MSAELVLLLSLHIAGLVVWCGALLYLPSLIASGARDDDSAFGVGSIALSRKVFTHVATPAAFFAIVSGSALFLLDRQIAVWLILKLTAVTGMTLCHVLTGALILRQERLPEGRYALAAVLLTSISALLIGVVLWLVLAKPPLNI